MNKFKLAVLVGFGFAAVVGMIAEWMVASAGLTAVAPYGSLPFVCVLGGFVAGFVLTRSVVG